MNTEFKEGEEERRRNRILKQCASLPPLFVFTSEISDFETECSHSLYWVKQILPKYYTIISQKTDILFFKSKSHGLF